MRWPTRTRWGTSWGWRAPGAKECCNGAFDGPDPQKMSEAMRASHARASATVKFPYISRNIVNCLATPSAAFRPVSAMAARVGLAGIEFRYRKSPQMFMEVTRAKLPFRHEWRCRDI